MSKPEHSRLIHFAVTQIVSLVPVGEHSISISRVSADVRRNP